MTEQKKPSLRRELLVELPKTMGRILLTAGIVASIAAMLITNTVQSAVSLLPSEIWFEPVEIVIPDIDLTKPTTEQFALFKRNVGRSPIVADWTTEFVLVNDAGQEFCRNRGTGLYGPASNGLTVLLPVSLYITDSCQMPPGCYYQDRHYEFEVMDITKTINQRSNRFSVSTAEGAGRCAP